MRLGRRGRRLGWKERKEAGGLRLREKGRSQMGRERRLGSAEPSASPFKLQGREKERERQRQRERQSEKLCPMSEKLCPMSKSCIVASPRRSERTSSPNKERS